MLWGVEPKTWAGLQEPTSKSLWISMMRAANVGWRTRMLDIGCGAGGACGLGRGLGAAVAGIDACPAMIDLARPRVRHADLRVAEMENLPFQDGEFNLVMAANSIAYASDPARAVREMTRVCASGGRLAIGIYGPDETCDQARVFTALRNAMPCPPPKGPLSAMDETALAELSGQGGAHLDGFFEGIALAEYANLETAWLAQRSAGWTQSVLQVADEDEVRDAVVAALRPCVQADGRVVLRNGYRFVTSRVP